MTWDYHESATIVCLQRPRCIMCPLAFGLGRPYDLDAIASKTKAASGLEVLDSQTKVRQWPSCLDKYIRERLTDPGNGAL